MAGLSKEQLIVENNQSFPNNNAGAITPDVLRSYNRDVIDSTVNQTTYTETSQSLFTTINSINADIDVLQDFSSSQHNLNSQIATTGSNTFDGNQTINGKVTLNNNGVSVELSPSSSVNGLNINNNVSIDGSLTASLQPGYVWLGNSDGIATAVSSGSLVVNAGAFNSLNDFTASQITKNSTLATYTGSVDTKFTTIGSQSGSWDNTILNQFTASQETKDATLATYTGSVDTKFSTIGGQSGSWINTALNTFTASQEILNAKTAYTGSNVFTAQQRISAGGLEVTGSVLLTPASVSTNASYPIPFVSGTTISKDSVDTLLYNPSTNQLLVSASTGQAQISPNAITFLSGSGVGTYSSILSKTSIAQTIETGYTIGISGNPSKIGAPSLASSTNPAIYAISGSGVPYVAIELQASQSFTDGRVTIKRPLVVEGGISGSTIITGSAQITGSLGVSGATTINGNINVTGEVSTDSRIYVFNQYGGIDIQQNAQGSGSQYPGMSMKVAPNTYPTDIFGGFTVLTEQGALAGTTYLGLVANSYTPQYGGTTVPMIVANGNNPGGNDTALIWTSNGNAEHWKKSIFKYGVEVSGSVNGNIVSQSIASSTASLDFGSSNFFELKLADSTATYVTATNVKPGQTVSLKITQATLAVGSVVFDSKFKFPAISPYTASVGVDDIDVLTFVTFSDTGSIYSAGVNNLV